MYKILLITIVLVTAAVACNNSTNKEDNSLKHLSQNRKADSLHLAYYSKLLGIENLWIHKDEFQLRIWFGENSSDTNQLFIFKEKNKIWDASLHKYNFSTSMNDEVILKYHQMVKSDPKSNYSEFLNEIEKVGIYTLNEYLPIIHNGYCNHGMSIWFEIVKDNKYHYREYPCWVAISDTAQLEIIKKTLNCAKKYFGFDLYTLNFDTINYRPNPSKISIIDPVKINDIEK